MHVRENMPRATAAEAEATARRILLAAHDAFTDSGFAAASVDDIARSAGVTRGAVYHHFASKTGLLRALVADLQAGVAHRVAAAAEAHGTPAARLRAGAHAFIDTVTDAETARVLLVEAPAALGWAEWRRLDAENSVRELRGGLAALGTLARDEVDAMTRLLSGAVNEAALWLAERPDDDTARRAAHGSLDRLLDAVMR